MLAAAVQLSCTSDEPANMAAAEALIRRAASYGAGFVATPECTNYLGPHDDKVARAEPLDGPLVARLSALADELSIHLLIGSINERASDEEAARGRCYNTSLLFDPDGKILAAYRKIHLFDVDVSDEVRFFESDTCVPGTDVVTAAMPFGTIGLSICYDLRFPEIYRMHVQRGATILAVPSAFTLTTGKDHWEPLLRARAIETQCWVIAPGQHGKHGDGGLRESFGHSMIIDPWGQVVAMAPDGVGLALAEIDSTRVDRVRRGMPVQAHRRAAGLVTSD